MKKKICIVSAVVVAAMILLMVGACPAGAFTFNFDSASFNNFKFQGNIHGQIIDQVTVPHHTGFAQDDFLRGGAPRGYAVFEPVRIEQFRIVGNIYHYPPGPRYDGLWLFPIPPRTIVIETPFNRPNIR